MTATASTPFSATGRTALVTGGGRAIGRGIALALAEAGAAVVVNDFYAERANAVAAEIRATGGKAVGIAADVTDLAAVRAMVASAAKTLGPIEILINNAGIPADGFVPAKFRDMDPRDWDKFLRLNLYGVLNCVKATVDGMCERRFGRIVTISSEAWRVGSAWGVSLYAAGKAGAIGFTRQLACELGPSGVTANCLSLGEMDNLPMAAALAKRYPTERLGRGDDVGAAVVYLVSKEAEWVTGQVLAVNGGLVTA
jgi:3-oxoacyl-[acyl-carrier protein] reductase